MVEVLQETDPSLGAFIGVAKVKVGDGCEMKTS